METINAVLLASGSSVITAIITWLLSRRQYKAEAQITEAKAIKEELGNYKIMINDMKEEVSFWHKQAEEYRKKFLNAMTTITALEIKIIAIEKELKIAQTKIENLEKKG